jgi:hypothetical protein
VLTVVSPFTKQCIPRVCRLLPLPDVPVFGWIRFPVAQRQQSFTNQLCPSKFAQPRWATNQLCLWCKVHQRTEATRSHIHWLEAPKNKPGHGSHKWREGKFQPSQQPRLIKTKRIFSMPCNAILRQLSGLSTKASSPRKNKVAQWYRWCSALQRWMWKLQIHGGLCSFSGLCVTERNSDNLDPSNM